MPSTRTMRARLGDSSGKSRPSTSFRSSASAPIFDSRGPAAGHDEREPAAACPPSRVLAPPARGEVEHVISQTERLGNRLHADGESGQLGVAVVVVGAAGSEHKMVVGDPFAITCTDDSRVEIDPGDECLAEPNVWRSPEDRPERVHDVRRVQEGGGNLVEERSEQVVVVPVDEEHVHGLWSSFLAQARPPNPPPTMTTRGRAGTVTGGARSRRRPSTA